MHPLYEIMLESCLSGFASRAADSERGGCDFARFFRTTPLDLIDGGLYKALAFSCYPGYHRKASLALLAKALGAEQQGSSLNEMLHVSTITNALQHSTQVLQNGSSRSMSRVRPLRKIPRMLPRSKAQLTSRKLPQMPSPKVRISFRKKERPIPVVASVIESGGKHPTPGSVV